MATQADKNNRSDRHHRPYTISEMFGLGRHHSSRERGGSILNWRKYGKFVGGFATRFFSGGRPLKSPDVLTGGLGCVAVDQVPLEHLVPQQGTEIVHLNFYSRTHPTNFPAQNFQDEIRLKDGGDGEFVHHLLLGQEFSHSTF